MPPLKDSQNASTLLGRAKDLSSIERLFAEGARLVSVLGPPGIGKTRVATEYAQGWSNGAWLCDTRFATQPAQLTAALAKALGLSEVDTEDPGHVAAALRNRGTMLIVLDGYERLVPAANPVLQAWLQAAPEAQFIVTSRRRLKLGAEVPHTLAPLSDADATALYTAHVTTVVAGPEPDQQNPDHTRAVRQLVSRLGGLPLAIILAAARSHTIGATQLVERLGARLDLLTDGTTLLSAAIDDSWDDLDEGQRISLTRAAMFEGGFSLDAAEAVLSLPHDSRSVIEVLEQLCDRSLLTCHTSPASPASPALPASPASLALPASPASSGTVRFDMNENIRVYARARQQPSSRDTSWHQRHVRYFLEAGGAWLAAGDHAQLAREKHNLLLMFAHTRGSDRARAALALAPVHTTTDEARQWHTVLSNVADNLGDAAPLYGDVLLARGNARLRLNLFGRAQDDFEAAAHTARSLGDDALLARALLRLGDILFDSDDRVRAGEIYSEAVAAGQRAGNNTSEARGHIGLARVARNDPSRAREHLETALHLLARSPNSIHVASATHQLGNVNLRLGRLSQAREYLERACASFSRLGSASGEAETLTALAVIDQERGDLHAAAARYDTSVALLSANGDVAREAASLVRQGSCLAEQGLVDGARECFQEAHAGFRVVGDEQGMCEVRGHVGVLEAVLGNLNAAERAFVDAESGGAHSLANRAVLQVQRGHLDIARGDRDAASSRYGVARRANDDRGWMLSHRSQCLRSAIRQLEHALDGPAAQAPTHVPTDSLVVATTGRWFRAPGHERVDLGRRGGLRRLLCALADHRRDNRNDALTRDALLAIGWPGERVQPESGARRVHTALWTLRKLGLRDVLISRDDGYVLDPHVALLRVDE